MKAKKDNGSTLPEGVTWEEVERLTKEGKFDHLLKLVDPSIFEEVVKVKDQKKAIKRVKKALEKTDPKHATIEFAEKMLEWMKKFAQIQTDKDS